MLEVFVNKTDIEFVTAKWSKPQSYTIAAELLIAPEHIDGLIYPQNVPAYLSNLVGLGLVSIHNERAIHESKVYQELEAYWTKELPPAHATEPDRTLKFDHGAICTTRFGQQFIHACHAK